MYVKKNSDPGAYYLVYQDQLGSILRVTDTNGADPLINGTSTAVKMSFDPWGQLRDADTWESSSTSPMEAANFPVWLWRGYTGHEHLTAFSLINMNGRCYDPALGRMLSADNYVQSGGSTQSFNRYSYVMNNPMKYTDPSGETWAQVIGTAVGMYMGGAAANGNLNPGKWDWKGTWPAVIIGGALGYSVGTSYSNYANAHRQSAAPSSSPSDEVMNMSGLDASLRTNSEVNLPNGGRTVIRQLAPAWIDSASRQLGVSEKTGENDGPEVAKYLRSTGLGEGNAWCGAFVNWCLIDAGVGENPIHPYRALAWRDSGVQLDGPAYGSIGSLARKGGGHVGFVVGLDADRTGWVVMLGG